MRRSSSCPGHSPAMTDRPARRDLVAITLAHQLVEARNDRGIAFDLDHGAQPHEPPDVHIRFEDRLQVSTECPGRVATAMNAHDFRGNTDRALCADWRPNGPVRRTRQRVPSIAMSAPARPRACRLKRGESVVGEAQGRWRIAARRGGGGGERGASRCGPADRVSRASSAATPSSCAIGTAPHCARPHRFRHRRGRRSPARARQL